MLGQLLGWKAKVALSLLEHIADLIPVLFHCEGSDWQVLERMDHITVSHFAFSSRSEIHQRWELSDQLGYYP